jgi:molybdenum cofactor cytidylyltransferase
MQHKAFTRQGKRSRSSCNAVGILVLAAGASRRFGGDKRRVQWNGERSLLQHCLRSLDAARLPLRVVLRDTPSDRSWYRSWGAPYPAVFSVNAGGGMGCTLAEGIGHCAAWDSTLVMPGDMPGIAVGTLKKLARASASDRIVAPVHGGQRGHPVSFGRDFYGEIAALDGDRGARDILARCVGRCYLLDVDDAGILIDIDTPEDLARYRDPSAPL